MFGTEPSYAQEVTATLVAEALFNLRTLTEWTIAANSEKDSQQRNIAAMPIRQLLKTATSAVPQISGDAREIAKINQKFNPGK